ncbi:MAG: hypothetical protein QMD92_03670 [bacterium]|nr:hypothetical protein [bacterium]
MKRIALLLSILFLFPILAGATVTELVNVPTSSTIAKGFIDLNFKMYNEGGVFVKLDLGISNRLMLGTSLDIEKAIGNQKVKCNFPPFISAKYCLTDGTKHIPGVVAIGYNPLGYSTYDDKDRTDSKELKGPYVSFTKPILPLGLNGHFHAGINFDTHAFKDSCLYFGIDLSINPELLMIFEANSIKFSGDDEKKYRTHAGIRYAISQQFEVGIDFKDLSKGSVTRQLKIRYLNTLF